MIPGIDYSFARPAPAAIRDAGFAFACRYLDPGAKGLTRAEADALAAAGVWVVANYETTATWMLGGFSAGQAAARDAAALAKAAGMPEGRPIYFSADFDASAGQITVIRECLDGVASVLGRAATGIYGSFAVVKAAMETGNAHFGWQSLAWSFGAWYPAAQIRQLSINNVLAGQAVDHNEATVTDYGQWMPGKPAAATVPATPAAPVRKITIPEEPMLLKTGKGAVTPIAIPDSASSLRFLAAGTAELEVTFHSAQPQTLSLSWAGGSHSLTAPKDVYSALVTRTDDGTGDVSVAVQ